MKLQAKTSLFIISMQFHPSDRAKYVNLLLKNFVIICSSLPISGFDQEAFNNISNVSVFEKPNVGRDMYKIFSFSSRQKFLLQMTHYSFLKAIQKILDQNITI